MPNTDSMYAGGNDGEYLDEAGYPDGKGTLDEGTGAYGADSGPTGDEAADDADQDDTGRPAPADRP